MKAITEYLSTKVAKPSIIKATDDTIRQIVKDELDRLGHDADLNHIDVSEVTYMADLFNLEKQYEDLNPDISSWNVSNVETMDFMFSGCKNFNQDLSRWDVSKVEYMFQMFYSCKNFNQDLSRWDVGKVKDMESMFKECNNFNQDLSRWDVSKVGNMRTMFYGCKKFNQDISMWDISNVKDAFGIFDDCCIKEEFKPKFKI